MRFNKFFLVNHTSGQPPDKISAEIFFVMIDAEI